MARGWESKAVADQIAEGESRQRQPSKTETTREQRVLKERLDSLQLSRSKLLQQRSRQASGTSQGSTCSHGS